ncbi:MAG: hypothetical protein ACRC5G_01395 [Cetobacterium sp.]
MRDTYLGLNQKNVLILKDKFLDGKGESQIKTEDLILIRRLQDFIASSKTVQVIVENNIYSWVHYEIIQEDLPMIFPSVKSLKKRVDKLRELGLIVNKAYRVNKEMLAKDDEDGFDKPGVYSVIKLSKDCRKIFDFSNMENVKTQEIVLEQNKGFPHEGVKGFPHEGVKGFPHEGVKGFPHEGVKPYPLKGVNKEYQEINTKNKHVTCNSDESLGTNPKGFPRKDKIEKFINENMEGIDYTKEIQVVIARHLKKESEEKVLATLLETYKVGLETGRSISEIATIIAKGNALRPKAKKETEKKESSIEIETGSTPEKKEIPSPTPGKKKETLGEKDLEDTRTDLDKLKEQVSSNIFKLNLRMGDKVQRNTKLSNLKTVEEVNNYAKELFNDCKDVS